MSQERYESIHVLESDNKSNLEFVGFFKNNLYQSN